MLCTNISLISHKCVQLMSKIPHPHRSFQLERQDLTRLMSGECLDSKVSLFPCHAHLKENYIPQVISAYMTLLQTTAVKVSNLLPFLI